MVSVRQRVECSLLGADRLYRTDGNEGWEAIMFSITIRNGRGKVVLQKDLDRNSQWSAHTALRKLFADQPAGSKATLSQGNKVIEEFTMNRDGYEFAVLNGDSVSGASRGKATSTKKVTKASKATVTKTARVQKNVKPKVTVKKAVKPASKTSTKKAAAANAPF